MTVASKTSMRLSGSLRLGAAQRGALRAQRPAFRGARWYSKGAEQMPPKGEQAPKGPYNGMFISIGVFTAGVAAYMYINPDAKRSLIKMVSGEGPLSGKPRGGSGGSSPTGPGGKPSKEDYQKVYNAIASKLENENYDDGSYAPVVLRLAWHTSGTYDKETNTGGSNGATMRFPKEAGYEANAGLEAARNFHEQFKEQFPWITYADLWTLGGICAVQEMGGPKIPWRPGREDLAIESTPPNYRLPDGDKGADHLRKIFHRMGWNDQEIVNLAGAHALGRCHKDRSGFDGPWTFSPTTFSNQFYTLLLEDTWQPRKWDGPMQYQDKETQSLMMLPSDYALIQDPTFKKYVQLYAKDEELFFKDFGKNFGKLVELGVPEKNFEEGAKGLGGEKYITFTPTSEQEEKQ